jgi:hypothetical protein
MKVKIKLKNLNNPITSKLNFVKMIKDSTSYGLKESKDVCDDIHSGSNQREIEVLDAENFIKEMKKNFGDYVDVYHPAYDRDLKILLVGVGNEADYIDGIIKLIEINPDRLKTILKRFEKEDLIEILTEVYDSLKL